MQNLHLEFRPARVVHGKETYVSYYVADPATDSLKRMRVRCNHVKGSRPVSQQSLRVIPAAQAGAQAQDNHSQA